MHICFLENKPNVAGTGPNGIFDNDTLTMSMNYQPIIAWNQTNGNAGTKANINAAQAEKKTVPGPQYVLLTLLTFDSHGTKSLEEDVTDNIGKRSTKVPRKENEVQDPTKKDPGRERAKRNELESMFGQDKDANGNSTHRMFTLVSAAGSSYVNLGGSIPVNDTEIFSGVYDDEVEGVVVDFNSLDLTTVVSPIPITRLHKDHPKEQIIGDPLSAPQIRRMTKSSQEHAMVIQRHDGIFISQDKYVAGILKKFNFYSVKIASTPIETNKALLKDEEAEDVDVHLYILMIRFQVTPKVSHLHAVKRIFRYLKGQPKLGLWYPRFLQLFLNNQIDHVEPFNDVYVTLPHIKKVFTNMKRQNKDFLGTVTLLLASMLVPQVVKGEGLGKPSEPQPPSSTAPPSHEEQVTTIALCWVILCINPLYVNSVSFEVDAAKDFKENMLIKLRLLIDVAGTNHQVVSATKLPILNPNELDLWKMKIVKYFLLTDYSLWERLARKNELKVRGTLLMALPDKHQLKFNIHKDAKTLMEAIEKRFRGNKKTKKIDADDLEEIDLKWQLAMLTVRAKRFLQRIERNLKANRPTFMGFDMFKVECYNCHRKGHFTRKCSVMVWAAMTRVFKQMRNLPTMPSWHSHLLVLTMRDNALVVLRQNLEKAEQKMDDLKLKLKKFQTSSKNLNCDDYLTSESDESLPPSPIYDRYQSGDGYHVVPPPYTGIFMPPKPDLVFHNAPNDVETVYIAFNVELSPTKPDKDLSPIPRPLAPIIKDWVSDSKDDSKAMIPQNVPSFVQPNEQVKPPRPYVKHVETYIPTANPKTAIPKPTSNGNRRNRKACFVCQSLDNLIKYLITTSKLVPISTARPVTTAVLKYHVARPRPIKPILTMPYFPSRRHINHSPSLKASNFPPKVTVVKAPMDKGVIDSRCSRHMIGNMSYLSDFEELNGGYVTFGGNPKGGKISGKVLWDEGNKREFSLPRTPQQNGIAERKNMTLIEATRTMLADLLLPILFWAEPEFEGRKPESEVNVSPSSSTQSKRHDDKTKREAKGKIPTVGHLSTNSTNTFSAAGPSNAVVWVLVDLPHGKRAIGTKWVFRNKKDKKGIIVRNKARLVAQGHTQEEGIDYKEVFAPVARIKAIRLFLAYASFMGFMVYQMDVKNAFMYGTIEEEVYVCQPPGFEDPDYSDKVYKVVKTCVKLFEKLMKDKFQMSLIGELTFFLGLQVKQKKDGIFISQDKYVDEILRKFGLTDGKSASTPIDTEKPLLKDPDVDEKVKIEVYAVDLKFLLSGLMLLLFLNASSIKYALTVNPNIYVSVIKQFWSSVSEKTVNDVPRLQALVDKKKVIIFEATIRDALRLADAEGIDCLPNEEIFTELARMGYKKPSTKLTFYKAFFSSQWKFLIHTILQCMSAKRTSWNEFSSSMASAVICLSTGKGCSRVEIPLFERMIVAQQVDEGADELNVEDVSTVGVAAEGVVSVADDEVLAAVNELSIPSPTPPTQPKLQDIPSTSQVPLTPPLSPIAQPPSPQYQPQPSQDAGISIDLLQNLLDTYDVSKQGRIIADMDADKDVILKDVAVVAKDVQDAEIEESLDDVDIEPAELQEVVEVVTAASATITVAALRLTTDAAPTLTTAPSAARWRNGVVIRDPERTATPSTIIHTKAKSKDKGKGIMVEEPKPLKKQAQIKQDEADARELEQKINKNIDWDEVIDYAQRKEKEDNDVKRYQALKRKPQTKAQARKNMMIYLRNMVGFKMDYFKVMTYDDIRLIFEKKFNSNVAFLLKTKEQIEEEDSRAHKRLSESQEDKAAKKTKVG
nr:copia protein [Tanacetum cinerariifolium]